MIHRAPQRRNSIDRCLFQTDRSAPSSWKTGKQRDQQKDERSKVTQPFSKISRRYPLSIKASKNQVTLRLIQVFTIGKTAKYRYTSLATAQPRSTQEARMIETNTPLNPSCGSSPHSRRFAICDELEKRILTDGVSLREERRTFLVTQNLVTWQLVWFPVEWRMWTCWSGHCIDTESVVLVTFSLVSFYPDFSE